MLVISTNKIHDMENFVPVISIYMSRYSVTLKEEKTCLSWGIGQYYINKHWKWKILLNFYWTDVIGLLYNLKKKSRKFSKKFSIEANQNLH